MKLNISLVLLLLSLLISVQVILSSEESTDDQEEVLQDLNCPKLSIPLVSPCYVENVTLMDIRVVMALGDSITAGFAMTYQGVGDYLGESRGKSWVIGGDINSSTIPNFIKQIGGSVTGQSLGRTLPVYQFFPNGLRSGVRDIRLVQLNAAVSTSELHDLDEQVDYLKTKYTDVNKNINWSQDWKLLSVFIGGNDVCASCKDKNIVDYWKNNYLRVLLEIKKAVPKVVVSVILLPEFTSIANISSESCQNIRRVLGFCSCLNDESSRATMRDTRVQLNQIIIDSAARVNRMNYTDFAVVVQPALQNAVLKRSFMSQFDGFHLNEFGSKVAARAIWNNLVSPPSMKKNSINAVDSIKCPNSETFLYYK